jgi:hypothetical protein
MELTSLAIFAGVYFLAVASPGPERRGADGALAGDGVCAARCPSPPASLWAI